MSANQSSACGCGSASQPFKSSGFANQPLNEKQSKLLEIIKAVELRKNKITSTRLQIP